MLEKQQQLYIIHSGSRVKIGKSEVPDRRCADIVSTTEKPCALYHETKQFPKKAAAIIERIAHKLCGEHRLKGEWFAMSPEEAMIQLNEAIRLYNMDNYDHVLQKKDWDDYNYQRLNVVLRPTDQRLILELGWSLEKDADTSFSQSDIVRIALREMAIARGIKCQ